MSLRAKLTQRVTEYGSTYNGMYCNSSSCKHSAFIVGSEVYVEGYINMLSWVKKSSLLH